MTQKFEAQDWQFQLMPSLPLLAHTKILMVEPQTQMNRMLSDVLFSSYVLLWLFS